MCKKIFLIMMSVFAIMPFAQMSAATQEVKSSDDLAWFWGGRGYGYGYGYYGCGYNRCGGCCNTNYYPYSYGYGCGCSGCCGSGFFGWF